MAPSQTRTARGSATPAPRPVSVLVVSGPDRGARLELRQGTAVIGTQEGCDLKLSDGTVSRQHLRLVLKPDGLQAVDLNSRNGVFFNGARIKEANVPVGAVLRVGESELRIDALGFERPQPGSRTELFGLYGQSSVMREMISTLEKAARTDATILLQGETGSGKEVAARAVHSASNRKGPLVVFDCGAASAGVIASELFGHVKGAFTDASATRVGAVEQANGGTLFLDEIGELDLSLQPSLLRLLESKEVKPVGGDKARAVDVRVVAATNRDLGAEVSAGRFRQDLLFRLAVVTVPVPPLRERLDDIPLLAEKLLADAGLSLELSEAALATLRSYAWPGNVRELRNVLMRAATLETTPEIAHPSSGGSSAPAEAPTAAPERRREEPELPIDYRQARETMLARFEREYLLNLLAKNERNVSRAARNAGVARGHLYRLLKKHGLV